MSFIKSEYSNDFDRAVKKEVKEEEQEVKTEVKQEFDNSDLDLDLTNGSRKVWLVKLPRYLVSQWSNTAALSGKQLATVKIKKQLRSNEKLKVKLVLNNNTIDTSSIPSEYDLHLLNTQVKNSYVFSEQNLDPNSRQEITTHIADIPNQPTLVPFDNEADLLDKKYVPFVKTIPKKTSIVGKIVHDCQLIPSSSDSKFSQILSNRNNIMKEAERPKVTLLNEIPGIIQNNAGPSIRGNNTSSFLKTTTNIKKDGRAIRMPQKDLLNLLFRLFEEFEYWTIKGLKERTKQPETYLKECLESIANLIKKGPYSSKYSLKLEYKKIKDAEKKLRLGYEEEVVEEKEEEDDDDMEDVV